MWFHVDDLSSAHVYLRMKPGMTLDDLTDELLTDCASLVKANSIAGCKQNSVYVVYTRWKNLKKTNSMVDGQVGFHRPENVRRMNIGKNNPIVRQIEKSRKEVQNPELDAEQQQRLREIQQQKKAEWKRLAKEEQKKKEAMIAEKEARSYDRIMKSDLMTKTSEMNATADATAAEEFEDDFF